MVGAGSGKAIAEKFGEDKRAAAKVLQIDNFRLENLLSAPLSEFPSWEEAISISKNLCVPLHPDYTFYWKLVSILRHMLSAAMVKGRKSKS